MVSTAREQINIRPTTSVYATYQRLSYRPWFAIAEFVDNSTQSYLDHRDELLASGPASPKECKLRVEISYDAEENTVTVYDNAYGMEMEELTRAIVLDSPPLNRSGRSEFGMGLKTAACWFGTTWRIETSRLGSTRKLTATIDVMELAQKHSETVSVEEAPAAVEEHFTKLTISQVRQPVRGRTAGRVLDQLGSMYRQDLRAGEIAILWNGQPVTFEEPPILTETLNDGTQRVWKRQIAFEVCSSRDGRPLPVRGWIAIRNPGKQRDAGLVLLRRDRVIIGGPEEGYRPVEVFGQPNMYRSQRLIGELQMDEWPVTQAKDGFDWSDGLEDEFIEQLRIVCREYGEYAESYRSEATAKRVSQAQMEAVSERTREIFANEAFGRMIAEDLQSPNPPPPSAQTQGVAHPASSMQPLPQGNVQTLPQGDAQWASAQAQGDVRELKAVSKGPITYALRVGTADWIFRLHWQDQLSDAHWMGVSYPQDNEIDVFLNTAHPFFAPYLGQQGMVELLQKFVIALALAEEMARKTSSDGRIMPHDFRNYMNKVLRRAAAIGEGGHGS